MEGRPVADDAALARHVPELRAAARRLTSSSHEADDLVQECLACAVEGADRVRDPELLGAWLHQVLRRRWYDQLRRRAVERRARSEGRPPSPSDPHDAGQELVRRALDALDPDSRRVLQLRFFESRTSVEIGDALGESSGTIRSRIFHALRRFEVEFRKLCPEETR